MHREYVQCCRQLGWPIPVKTWLNRLFDTVNGAAYPQEYRACTIERMPSLGPKTAKYAGKTHDLGNDLCSNATNRGISSAQTHTISTKSMMTRHCFVPRPKKAGPDAPVPSLDKKERKYQRFCSQSTRPLVCTRVRSGWQRTIRRTFGKVGYRSVSSEVLGRF